MPSCAAAKQIRTSLFPRTTFARLLVRSGFTFGLSVAAVAAMIWLGATVSREFLPELDEGSIWLHAELPGGLSLAAANRMVSDLRDAVSEFPETSNVVLHVGRNDDG